MSTSCSVRAVLFDLDGTLVDHDGAAATAVEQWLTAKGWANAETIGGLAAEWDVIAERHYPAYRARRTTFQGQRRLRVREFLPAVGIDASDWSDERLDDAFDGYLIALACRRLGVRPSETAYVGDRIDVDAIAAGAAGLRGIWLNREGAGTPAGVEAISNLADLENALKAT